MTFRSKPENATLDAHAFAPLEPGWEYTAIPVLDVTEHLEDGTPVCWQGTYGDGQKALARLGLEMLTADDVEHLHELATRGEAIELPAFTGTPTAEMDLANRRIADAANRAAMARLGWKPGMPIANFGKGWIAGAPPNRAYLMGWWVQDLQRFDPKRRGPGFVQPRPPVGSLGRHGAQDQFDDGTNLWGKRRVRTPGKGLLSTLAGPLVSAGAQAAALMKSLLGPSAIATSSPTTSSSSETHEGIDVSGHQSAIDWARVRRAGVEFAYVKATEGTSYRDKRAAAHAAGALAAGLELGAYHYLRVRQGTQDAAEQAMQFLAVHRSLGCTLRPALDVETEGNEGRTFAEYLAAIRAFVAVVQAELGAPPILYTYPGFWAGSSALRGATDLAVCPLWIAHYTAKGPTIPAPWKAATLWQYAAGAGVIGHVDGVTGAVDRDRLFGPLEAIRL